MIKEVALVPDVAGTLPAGLAVIGDDTNGNKIQDGDNLLNVRRLNRLGTVSASSWTSAPLADISDANTGILMVVSGVLADDNATDGAPVSYTHLTLPTSDLV